MQQELFGPLGMTSAGYGAPGVGTLDEPWGHQDRPQGRTSNQGDNAAAWGPSGTVHASLWDWAKFIRLHLSGSEGGVTLYPATLARLHQEWPRNRNFMQRYGWGWGMFDEFGGLGLRHNGSNHSWYCRAVLYPEEGFALLAVSNIGGAEYGNGDEAVRDTIELLKAREREASRFPMSLPPPLSGTGAGRQRVRRGR